MDAVVTIGADVKQALRGIDQLNKRLNKIDRASVGTSKSMKRLQGASMGVSTALKAATVAFAGFAASRGLQGILDATQRMEGFRTQLTTYLGSQQLANAELERLSTLARSLPQDVDELTQAFVIFNRYGIDASNESMKAFSNIAAANSKSMIQFGEAVADAMTGEFERLKEFGIKVSTENGKFTAKIGEDQVAVATSTSALVEQLKALGQEGGRFGNVTVGALTMAMSNFRGAVFEVSAALGEGGLGLAIADTVNQITALITENDKAVEAFGDRLTKAFLYAKEAAILVYDNIGLIAKAFGLLLAIKVTTWVYGAVAAFGGMAIAIGRQLLPALVFLGKVLRATALLALRHPLIGAVAIIIGGIEYLTGAVSGLAEKFGLIGDDSALDQLLGEATALADTISGPVVDGMNQFNTIGERVDAQFASIKERADQTTEAVDEATAATERQRIAVEAARAAEESRASAVQQIITDKTEELRISGLTQEAQLALNLEKAIERKTGKEITDQEREQLRLLAEKTNLQKQANQLRDEFVNNSVIGLLKEMQLTDELFNKREEYLSEQASQYDLDLQTKVEYYGQAMSLEEQFLSTLGERRTQATQDLNERLYELEYNRITDLYAFEIETGRKIYSEKERMALRAATQERQRQQELKDAARSRVEFDMKSESEKAQWAIQQGASVFESLGKHNKQAFEAAKAFNIANAIMNTYTGATKALAMYPPPFNFIAAAAVVASGFAQVASIRSQSYSGRQLGGPVMNGTSYMVGENGPEMFTPTTNGSITRNGNLNTGEAVNVNFNITANDATGFDDLLIQRQGMITQMVSDAMQERGQRSML